MGGSLKLAMKKVHVLWLALISGNVLYAHTAANAFQILVICILPPLAVHGHALSLSLLRHSRAFLSIRPLVRWHFHRTLHAKSCMYILLTCIHPTSSVSDRAYTYQLHGNSIPTVRPKWNRIPLVFIQQRVAPVSKLLFSVATLAFIRSIIVLRLIALKVMFSQQNHIIVVVFKSHI